jgi:RNA polymerase sigma-54 factor
MSNISQRLDFRQQQNLVMTPQMQQAIKLLQMNNVELAEYIESEISQNPLLEKDDTHKLDQSDAQDAALPNDHVDGIRDREKSDEFSQNQDSDFNAQDFDEAWTGNEATPEKSSSDFDAGLTGGLGSSQSVNWDNPDLSLENTLSSTVTLREHLMAQINVAFDDQREQLIGSLLVDMLDEQGYLRANTEELAARLAIAPDRMAHVLERVKQFDPTGIFAKDLSECLALQLDERGQLDAPMKIMLQNLPMIASHDLKNLAQLCGVNETYLADMIDEIRALNPRPASNFEHFVAQTVVPDVLMKRLPKDVGGGWRVELNNDTLPRVLINQEYFTQVSAHAKNKDDKKYLDDQMQNASWLVRALDQRAKTILKVAGAIVESQDAFFLYGVEFLVPLTLKDIAAEIEMHESTVSRVTSNKYIGTPRGIFELKYFFSTALTSSDGSTHSAEAVKARIKSLIDAEAHDAVLSDDTIVEILKKDGIELARRTVAKYREAMNIASSVQRRRQKKQ